MIDEYLEKLEKLLEREKNLIDLAIVTIEELRQEEREATEKMIKALRALIKALEEF